MQAPASAQAISGAKRRFRLILIKPSHYDDDGYVIQWFRSVMPSNSLAALYGLAIDAAKRQALGPDVEIDVLPIDETNTRVRTKDIIADMSCSGPPQPSHQLGAKRGTGGIVPSESKIFLPISDFFVSRCKSKAIARYRISIAVRGPRSFRSRRIRPLGIATQPAVGPSPGLARGRNTALPRPATRGRVLWSISTIKS